MFRVHLLVGLSVLLVISSWSQTARAADLAAGKQAYAICAACHGQSGEGNVAMNAPEIAGQESWYLERQLEAYRSGIRGTAKGDVYGAQMRPMAMAIADPAAIANLVAYIASMPVQASPPTVTGDAAAGKSSFMICATCHGADGQGNEQMGGPRLAGQSDWYLVRQLNNYKNGLRGYSPKDIFGNQMKPMASTLPNEAAIDNVVAYIETLH